MKLVLFDMFLVFKLFRVLDLSGSYIIELLSCIGDVRELCYFDVLWILIRRLFRFIVCLREL